MTGAVRSLGYIPEAICDGCHVGGFGEHCCTGKPARPCKCRVYVACHNYRPAYLIGAAVPAHLAALAVNAAP